MDSPDLCAGAPCVSTERVLSGDCDRDGVVTVISAAADEPDGCLPPEGAGHFTMATLQSAARGLERLVAGSRLPAPLEFP